ncbi:MAG: hypothetical protein B7733_11945 [Myxococcales bacterium FL481]|nr:MAG: hypothetical protein B7733_11945 [Myxococcales bacterium FL481]
MAHWIRCLRTAPTLMTYFLSHSLRRLIIPGTVSSLALTLFACGEDPVEPADLPPWVSDDPNLDSDGHDESQDAGDDDGGGVPEAEPPGDTEDPGLLIEEADIVHIDGNVLYALSRLSGLSVIDIGDPLQLRVLGQFRASGTPFEMYVEQGHVFVMYSTFGHYIYDTEAMAWRWVHSSRLLALDATDPREIVIEGEFDLPGRIEDSRRIDDRLYLVSHEDGYCWSCDIAPNTTVTSLDVSNVSDVKQVDQLTFAGQEDSYGGGRRSVSATTERLYLAGVEYQWGADETSTIDVVDVSDPAGKLAAGASVAVAGAITSRWQMNEHEGVLRVISQPNPWSSGHAPVIETFTVESSQQLIPLGRVDMHIPEDETLRSVRFDGERGYAITALEEDPLFTIDLSDPAAPKQVGELEMPGWVYHMEPRGDRMIGVGFDRNHPDGSINVSLFDVSDMASPTLLQRVHFGGDWAQFAEDQNRIHKALTIDEDRELMLVPFGGWLHPEQEEGHAQWWSYYRSGVQLVDMANDTLTLRGLAESRGQARRAFFHGDTMMSVADEAVQSFDITDRDHPAQLDYSGLAANVGKTVPVGDMLVRLSTDWWTAAARLDLVALSDAESADPIGEVDLRAALGNSPDQVGWVDWSNASMFAHGNAVYLATQRETWHEVDGKSDYAVTSLVLTIDVSDPATPRHVSTLSLPQSAGWWGGGSHLGYLRMPSQRAVVKSGHHLVIGRVESDWDETQGYWMTGAYEIIDLSDPLAPRHAATIDRPRAAALGGLLQTANDEVYSWRMERVGADEKVAFYAERIDLSGATPALAPPVNTPGALVALDADTGRAMTVDFRHEDRPDLQDEHCWRHPQFAGWDWTTEHCRLMHVVPRLVHLSGEAATLVGELALAPTDRLDRLVVAGGRVFARTHRFAQWDDWEADDVGPGTSDWDPQAATQQIAVITGLQADQLQIASRTVIGGNDLRAWESAGTGPRLFVAEDQGLTILDATDPAAPIVRREGLYGDWISEVRVIDNTAFVALGDRGLQRVVLE